MASPVPDSYSAASGGVIYGGRSGIPAWRAGQAVNSWVEISGSAMSNFPPSINPGRASGGIDAILNAWCGLSIDTRSNRVWSAANGGHDDTHENGVRYLDLNMDSPAWVEVLASSSGFTIPNNAARYSDGRPASGHSYFTQQFIEARNRAMRFGATAVSTSGNSFSDVDGFEVTANVWDAAATFSPIPVGIMAGLSTIKDPVTEDVYVFITNASVRKWTQATATWSTVNVGFPPVDCTESSVAFDSTRNRILLLKGANSDCHHTFNPGDGTFTDQTLTGSGAAAVNAAAKAIGLVYVPDLDAYLVRLRAAGGAVYSINASTFAVTALSTTGGTSIPVTAAISGAPENVYSKFLVVPAYNVIIYVPAYAANAWAYRYI